MNDLSTTTTASDGYAALIEPATIRIQRLLPGPAGRVWRYLTDGGLRRRWLASGEMELAIGAPFELVWRNDELTPESGPRPEGFAAEHRMQSRILSFEPERQLTFSWGETSEVSFELEPVGSQVLLTVTHRRAPSADMLRKVSAGWHSHLDILVAILREERPAPFWEHFLALHADYEARLPS